MKRKDKVLIYLPILLVLFLLLTNACEKDDAPDAPVLIATLTTATVIDITTTTATGSGMVTIDGGASVTERGICWGTSANPTVANYKIIAGTGIGSFTGLITGLTENTFYYVRAYAFNSAGIAYGNEQSFTSRAIGAPFVTTTVISEITTNTATSGGDVTDDGEGIITERGICYSTTQNPTTESTKIVASGTTGAFSSPITGLSAYTTYYVKAYATNSAGTSYGNELSFTTFDKPAITTAEVTNITATTVSCGGEVTSDGGLTIIERGLCYSTTLNPTTENSKVIAAGTIGVFTCPITDLADNTTYYIRAYATNSEGTAYGNEISFKTPAIILPTVNTAKANEITTISALCGGIVTNDGYGIITERGICYNNAQNPTIENTKIVASGTTGSFASQLTELNRNTTYYVKAFATNSAGTAYGNEMIFQTFTAIDGDGNGYYSVIIGTQEWLIENLKTTKYNDGTDIPLVEGDAAWAALTTPGCCFYNNDATSNKETYGALYNWYTIDPSSNGNKNIAPVGWHVPTLFEWRNLESYMAANGYNYDGTSTYDGTATGYKIAKSLGSDNTWAASGNDGAVGNTDYPEFRNKSGFTALPGGYRRDDSGSFPDMYVTGLWWTSSNQNDEDAWNMYIGSSNNYTYDNFYNKKLGLSVRCIKD